MACRTHVSLYYDLEGKPTGEYSVDCVGDCANGDCKKVAHRAPDGQSMRVYCACVKPDGSEGNRDECPMELVITRGPGGKVEIIPLCCPKPCNNKKCEECQLVSYGKVVTVLDLSSDRPKVRQVEEFRCECKPIESKKLRDFYQDKICKLVAFATSHGIQISSKDLFHVHVITDISPICGSDETGNQLVGEQFIVEHYRGLLAHAHEYDSGRSETEDNFNIVIDGDGEPRFVGSTKTVYAGDPRIPAGVWPVQIHFRLCTPGTDCPECITKIHCDVIKADLCVGLRRRWPKDDPALGKP